MNLEYICEQMVRILHGNITCISKSGAIEACYGDMAAQYNPLFTNSEFLSAVHNREKKDYPDLFYEKDTILYAVISLESGEIQNETNNESKSGSRLDEKKHFAKIVVGPVSTEKHTKDSEHYLMQHHHISNETGFRLSFCELKVFGSGILMFYHMITGKELTINDLWQKNGIRETDIIEVKGQISSVIFEHQEQELPHNPYDQEVRELDSIRHGDVEMLNRSLAETYRGEVGQLAKNQVRQSKNIAICVIALASRAAISGGMIPEEAFSMVDGYIMKDAESAELKNAINCIMQGETYIQPSLVPALNSRLVSRDIDKEKINSLTKRELEVLIEVANGLFNKEIATSLNISERTVKNHISNIFKKIDVSDRTQAAVFAIKNDLIKLY